MLEIVARRRKLTSKRINLPNGQLGGRLLAVSATDGKQLAEYHLNAAPVWDSIALADGQLYISLADGTVQWLSSFPNWLERRFGVESIRSQVR